jgi:hypothetical protein
VFWKLQEFRGSGGFDGEEEEQKPTTGCFVEGYERCSVEEIRGGWGREGLEEGR